MLVATHHLLADGVLGIQLDQIKIVIAGLLVGAVVGITGMGGGALMTPALIFLGVGSTSTVVTADLTASAVYKAGGSLVHWRHGAPNLRLAGWLILGSVPMAFLGPFLIKWIAPGEDLEKTLQLAIGFALLLAVVTFALRLYVELRRTTRGKRAGSEPVIRPVPTVLIGALGGTLVGITSVGSGSVIMIALVMLYPTLSPVKLVGTDLVQAVPLVAAAAISNIAAHGLDLSITIPLIIGSVPGSMIGSRIAPKVPTSIVRRALIAVLTVSGLALLDKAGFAPLGSGEDDTHPIAIVLVGIAILVVVPFVWGFIRKTEGLPMFGAPTVAQIETGAVEAQPETAGEPATDVSSERTASNKR